jgi:hypothetical protein
LKLKTRLDVFAGRVEEVTTAESFSSSILQRSRGGSVAADGAVSE